MAACVQKSMIDLIGLLQARASASKRPAPAAEQRPLKHPRGDAHGNDPDVQVE